MKFGIYLCIMKTELISAVYFINPSHQSVSLRVSFLSLHDKGSVKHFSPFVATQRLGKHISAARDTDNNIKIVLRVTFRGSVCITPYGC
jgi:hypothetical protein